MGVRSIGQADSTTITGRWARRTTDSPGAAGDGRNSSVPSADHGMAMADPSCTGDWDAALTEAGIAFRDEAYGFLYLDV